MPGALLHAGAVVFCAHGGLAQPASPNPRVRVGGAPTATLGGPWLVSGCLLPPEAGGPCVLGRFIAGAARVTANGQPVVLADSPSTATPGGAPLAVASAQGRVRAV